MIDEALGLVIAFPIRAHGRQVERGEPPKVANVEESKTLEALMLSDLMQPHAQFGNAFAALHEDDHFLQFHRRPVSPKDGGLGQVLYLSAVGT